jgi:hypothetical protein
MEKNVSKKYTSIKHVLGVYVYGLWSRGQSEAYDRSSFPDHESKTGFKLSMSSKSYQQFVNAVLAISTNHIYFLLALTFRLHVAAHQFRGFSIDR